jgi:hypothetical protein
MTTTTAKPYTKQEMIRHFFKVGYVSDDAFVMPTGQKDYYLIHDREESELERMMSKKEIVNYITFEHILSTISEFDNFLSQDQLSKVAKEIEEF